MPKKRDVPFSGMVSSYLSSMQNLINIVKDTKATYELEIIELSEKYEADIAMLIWENSLPVAYEMYNPARRYKGKSVLWMPMVKGSDPYVSWRAVDEYMAGKGTGDPLYIFTGSDQMWQAIPIYDE